MECDNVPTEASTTVAPTLADAQCNFLLIAPYVFFLVALSGGEPDIVYKELSWLGGGGGGGPVISIVWSLHHHHHLCRG